VDILNIQDIQDDKGYIDALGKKRTAEVVRDATIGEAEAKRDADIKSAEARQKGEIATANALQEISNAERERDTVQAQNTALVRAEQARIDIAAQVAAADETKKLNVAEVAAQQARTVAETELELARKTRKQAELDATVIVNAEKERDARIIKADGEREAATREGEASRIRAEKDGQGDQAMQTAQAEGRKATAAAVQAEQEAEAAGAQAKLLAEATGREALLMAEARGTEAKAQAFAKLDQAGRFLMILEALPPVINAIGNTMVAPTAQAIGDGLANIKEVRVVDLGGSNNGKSNVLSRFANMPVETIFTMAEQAKAAGFGPVAEAMLAKMGLSFSDLARDEIPVEEGETEVVEE
jgi:flotillin